MKESFEANRKTRNPIVLEIINSLSQKEKDKISADVEAFMNALDAMTPADREALDIKEYIEDWGPHGGEEEELQKLAKGREMPDTHSRNRA